MRKLIGSVLIAFMIMPCAASAQNFIGKSYKEVKKKLRRYKTRRANTTTFITDSAGILQLTVRGGEPANFTYTFDENGKCRSEKVTAYCDSCYRKYLSDVLNNEKYGWKKINMNQYVSAFEHKLMIELPVPEEPSRFYLILRTNWVKETYEMLNPSK